MTDELRKAAEECAQQSFRLCSTSDYSSEEISRRSFLAGAAFERERAAKVAIESTKRMSVDYFPHTVGERIARAIPALGEEPKCSQSQS